jgi:hypothetical protein
MPLAGQGSDKIGNRYEGKWIALQCADILGEVATSIQLDPPGSDDQGFEFWLEKSVPEWHQVKRQTAKGTWTLNQLTSVLQDFWEKLKLSNCECHFVSSYQAHELFELAERARSANTFNDFETNYIATETWRKHFEDLRGILKEPLREELFYALKRIFVRVMDERTLDNTVSSRFAALVDHPVAETIRDVVAQYALENVHKHVTATELWNHLRSRNLYPRQWNNSPLIRDKLGAQNFRYATSLSFNLPETGEIPRTESRLVLEAVLPRHRKQNVVITGAAGGGKSSVVLQVIRELEDRHIPYLALRVDSLERVSSAKSIGSQLELPDSPAYVLGGYAKDRPSVLILDQLDAVSLASGRNAESFQSIAELIDQAGGFREMRLVLICRAYDMQHDTRLQKLLQNTQTTPVRVEPLRHQQVSTALEKLGFDATTLSARQLDFYSLPLHLKLLGDLPQSDIAKAIHFTTTKSLFDAFWDHKRVRLEQRLAREPKWIEVLDTMVNYMSQKRVLTVPRSYLDDHERDVKAMTSEQVLTFDGSKYSFFHERFFDYVFARRFVSKHKLITFLEQDPQHLFRRAQVRQVLQHRRDEDFAAYLSEVECLIGHPAIRYHLKQVAYSFLGALPDPTLEEWQLLQAHLLNPQDDLHSDVLNAIQFSPAWFDLLREQGMIQTWLLSKPHHSLAFTLIRGVVAYRQDAVAELLEPCLEDLQRWSDDLVIVARLAGLTGEGKLSAFFLKMIELGAFDGRPFWDHVLYLGRDSSPFAITAIGRYLARAIKRALEVGEANPFSEAQNLIDDSVAGEGGLVTLAEAAPEVYVKEIFPIVLQLVHVHQERDIDGTFSSSIWRYHYGRTFDAAGVILTALKRAIRHLAATKPEQLEGCVSKLVSIPVDTAQELLVDIFTAAPQHFASQAHSYFTTHPYGLDSHNHGEYSWGARSVVEAVAPYWSDDQLRQIEAIILERWPRRDTWHWGEKRKAFTYPFTRIGWSQLVLLDGLPFKRLTPAGLHRLQEWRRKFNYETEPLPRPRFRGGIAQTVGAPRPGRAHAKMTDAQWLAAMKKYDHDNVEWVDNSPIGGASQLATVFRAQVKHEPQRFITFIDLLPAGINRSYIDALLWGLMDTSVSVQEALPVLERCHAWPGRPFGSAICRFAETRAGETLPASLLDMVSWYATHDPDPEADTLDDKQVDGGFTSRGINSVRGRAAETIMHLIWDHPERMRYLVPAIQEMLSDVCLSVRVCVAEILLAMLRHDRDLAVNFFLKLAQVSDDRFFCARSVDDFLYYTLGSYTEALKPIVERLADSSNADVSTYATRRLTLVELGEHSEAGLKGRQRATDAQRVAIAQIFAANVTQGAHRAKCEAELKKYFYDHNEAVSEAAANCFQQIAFDDLPHYKDLIEVYVKSPAFKKGHDHLLYALDRSNAMMPSLIVNVCNAWLDQLAELEKNMGYPSFVDDLAFRAYRQSLHLRDAVLQVQCLDLIDRVAGSKKFGVKNAFEQFERG